MGSVKDILNFIRGTEKKQFHLVSYHVDPETDKVVIDWAGRYADAKENSFMAFNGSIRFPEKHELNSALTEWLKTNTAPEYHIGMAYQRIREIHNIK